MGRVTSLLTILLIVFNSLVIKAQRNNTSILAGNNVAIVQTEKGKVKGYLQEGIFTYKGIPYATADRFMPPIKPTAWQEVRSTMAYGPVCPTDATLTVNDEFEFAFNHNFGYQNENCLNLNIWTPQINDYKKRPVMVWLHGGGFTAGSSIELPSYDGENLAKKGDVVVVSLNHRLNVLGYLDLSAYGDKYKHSANAGLLDIVAALKWIKTNIAQFGGDTDNITIFGQSGGGGKVTCLMNAPSAKGSFQKAIVESGSYIEHFMDSSVAKQIAAALLNELNLQPAQIDSLQTIAYDKLNSAGKKALIKVQQSLIAAGRDIPSFELNWEPVLDGSFLPFQPSDSAAKVISKDIPLLVGSTKNEFMPFNISTRDIDMDKARELLQTKYGDKSTAFIAAVKKAYPTTEKPSDYTDIDMIFRPAVIRQANLKVVVGAAPVYMYLFAWQSPINDGIYKAMHCMDIAFQFNNINRCIEMTGGGKEAYNLANKISEAWINFATTGNPNTENLPVWLNYTPLNGATMIFDNNCELKYNFDKEILQIAATK